MQVTGIKAFVKTPNEANRMECALFSKPLLSCVDAIVEFVESRNLRGKMEYRALAIIHWRRLLYRQGSCY